MTDDAGRTWRRAAMPASMDYSCATLPQQLNIPGWTQAESCTIDPWDPSHLYAVMPAPPSTATPGLSLYESRDGGSSWRQLHTWPKAYRSWEIRPTSSGLYVVILEDAGGTEGTYRSADGGATWTELPLKGPVRAVDYFGLGGRLLATAWPQLFQVPRLFQVNPITGGLTPLGGVPFIAEPNGIADGVISAAAISEGSQPSLVVSGLFGTFVRSLPPLR